jgi:hypothetical protein
MSISQEDALTLLVRLLRQPNHGSYSPYGYGVYLPTLLRHYLETQGLRRDDQDRSLREMMPTFYDAAWELCRRGILRPGVRGLNEQATPDGSAGNGYSITPFGRQWLAEADRDDFIPTEPERFAQMLAPYRQRFGPSFQERAQEAIRCYGAHAYLACCAMCGAAAESILLATAIAKEDEDKVLSQYNTSGGRKRVENIILGKAPQQLRDEYTGHTTLLKYWRDQAAHGRASGIKDSEAFASLGSLLRFAIFVNDRWDELTTK